MGSWKAVIAAARSLSMFLGRSRMPGGTVASPPIPALRSRQFRRCPWWKVARRQLQDLPTQKSRSLAHLIMERSATPKPLHRCCISWDWPRRIWNAAAIGPTTKRPPARWPNMTSRRRNCITIVRASIVACWPWPSIWAGRRKAMSTRHTAYNSAFWGRWNKCAGSI